MTVTKATPQHLYLLQLGNTTLPTPRGPLEMTSGSYLVQMSDGQNILIDTGLPMDYTPSTGTPPTRDKKNVLECLAALGLHPDDINILICTHFDVDHAGNNDLFSKAEIIVQRSHYEQARNGHERYASARAHWDNPSLNYHLVDGDTEILPGLTVIETSGHALGHQSVLVRLPETGSVLLAIDAVMFERLFTTERQAGPGDDNAEQLNASTRKLLDLVEREHVALVIFGHDGLQWQTLKKAPESYS
jgi:N-acyl homoserine lactone hydrolase